MAAIEPVLLEFAPGLYRQGTANQCPNGRFADGNLIRMGEGYRRPVKGWTTGLEGTLSGAPRTAHGWKDNDSAPWALLLTPTNQYLHDGSTLDNITPMGWASTDANASSWTADNLGQLGLCCNDEDQTIYEITPGGAGDLTAVTNAPDADALVVTPESFIFALGADGDPRAIAWPDGYNYTVWTPTATNRAESAIIQTKGALMCGSRVNGGTLIWTTNDIHFARYVGLPDVYSIKPAGDQCGIIGRNAYATVDQTAYWMGLDNFWIWMGYAEPIPCEISDDVFTNINAAHRHKVWGWHNAKDGEVWFFYPRGSATECSHAAVFCYRGQPHWAHHALARTCGFEAGTFSWPVMVTSAGAMLKHEFGYAYDEGTVRFLSSGLFKISEGAGLLFIDEIIPDEATEGDCEVYFHIREELTGAETTFGPYTADARIPVEAPGRYVRMEIRAADEVTDFRIGNYSAVVREWSAF